MATAHQDIAAPAHYPGRCSQLRLRCSTRRIRGFLGGMDFVSAKFCSKLCELCADQGSDIGHGRASCIECDTGKECASAAAHLSSCYDNSSLLYADNLWNWLYRRSFMLKHQLSFDEDLTAGAELDFRCRSLLQCQSYSACEEVTYFCQFTPWAAPDPEQRLSSTQHTD